MNISIASGFELEILNIMWDKGCSITTSEILEKDKAGNDLIAVLTYLNRMCKKGLVEKKRDEGDRRSNVYNTLVSRDEYSAMLTKLTLKTVHNGSAESFIASLFNSEILSDDNKKQIKDMLNEL